MDRALSAAVQNDLRAKLLLLAVGAPPRLDEILLPIAQLNDGFIDRVLNYAAKSLQEPITRMQQT